MNCCRPDTSKPTPAQALRRTGSIDSPTRVEPPPGRPQPRRDSPTPLREGLRSAHRGGPGGVGCSEYEREGLADVKAHADANPNENPDPRNPSRLSVGSGAQHRPEARRGRVR